MTTSYFVWWYIQLSTDSMMVQPAGHYKYIIVIEDVHYKAFVYIMYLLSSAATAKVLYACVSDINSAYALGYLEMHTGSHSHIKTKHSM